MTVLCQWCGAPNPEDRELCQRCSSNLLVFSGGGEPFEDDDESIEASKLAFDEHVLERMSGTEDAVKRMAAMVAALDERVDELERSVALLDSGIKALIDLLAMEGIEHRLFGAWDGAEACSAAAWAARAKAEIADCHASGAVPILVGGTGLYLKVLLEGIAPIPAIDPDVRAMVRAPARGCAPTSCSSSKTRCALPSSLPVTASGSPARWRSSARPA